MMIAPTIHRTNTRAVEAVLGPVALATALLATSCAAECPHGTTAQLDQCVAVEQAAHPCAVLPRVKEDERGLVALQRVDLPTGTCFWIDRTEVTVEAYRRWLTEVAAPDVTWDTEHCDWKQTRTELSADEPGAACDEPLSPRDHDPFADRKPMRCVDFCDAAAFCRWADKHLCSDDLHSGNGLTRGNVPEWPLACTNGSSTAYPWGDEAADARCRALEEGAESCVATDSVCGPDAVGASRSCASQAGAVDLIGNVAEWSWGCVNVASDDKDEPRGCLALGGSFEQPLQSCALQRIERNDARLRDVGFRCCADLSPTETVQMAQAVAAP